MISVLNTRLSELQKLILFFCLPSPGVRVDPSLGCDIILFSRPLFASEKTEFISLSMGLLLDLHFRNAFLILEWDHYKIYKALFNVSYAWKELVESVLY